jgi:thymidine kinase
MPSSMGNLAANSTGCPTGSIEVIVGSMFSGKTEELIRVLRRAEYARQSIQVFKPQIDDRYSLTHVASHDSTMLESTVIDHAAEIYLHLRNGTQVVGIDEGQFFDDELVDVANDLAERGIRVIIAGLDMNWKGEPFHPMPALMAVAEVVRKLQAVCVVCGSAASRTQRIVSSPEQILVGDRLSYQARCRRCFKSADNLEDSQFDATNDDILTSELFDQVPLN